VRLSYGELQIAVAIVFLVLALVIAGVFAVVARRTVSDVPLERVQRTGYWLRRRWLAFLGALLVVVVGSSLLALPYASGERGRTTVVVRSGQFFWSFEPPQVAAGTRVRFDVTSLDVNHGFGIYDPRGRLLGSVQAMPGYHNKLDLTLRESGEYRVLCFEFCGLNHHAMQGVFRVVER